MKTIADVFIVETLDPDDEGNGRLEGSSISHLLRLHGKNPIYRYVRTRQQFKKAIKSFANSNYRYLHISAHADAEGMCTTNREEINYNDLADILVPYLKNRRLFLSACSMVHDKMAKEIIPKTGCYSIVGPKDDIDFAVAAVFWPSIYHLMFAKSGSVMKHTALKANLTKVANLFDVKIGYYSRSRQLKRGYTEDILKGKE